MMSEITKVSTIDARGSIVDRTPGPELWQHNKNLGQVEVHKSRDSSALQISRLEQITPRGWTRILIFFSLEDNVVASDVVRCLKKALHLTREAIPNLACKIVPDVEAKTAGSIRLERCSSDNDFSYPWIVRDLRKEQFPTYDELRKANFPQSKLDPALLCGTNVFPDEDEPQYVLVPQVNMISGGLILCLSMHHAIYDAQSIDEFLRVWAHNCRFIEGEVDKAWTSLDSTAWEQGPFDISEVPAETDNAQFDQHPEYMLHKHAVRFTDKAFRDSHRARVYRLTPEKLAVLKADCSQGESPRRISTNDAVCALLWQSIIRARGAEATSTGEKKSHHIINVDLRSRSDPPLAKSSFGCPMSYARPAYDIGHLTGPENNAHDLATLSHLVRDEVDKRTPDYVRSILALLTHVPNKVVGCSWTLKPCCSDI